MSSKIDNIYMYMPIILKSMSLYAISSQPLWFTVGDIICLCVAFSAFNQAVNFCSYQAPPHLFTHTDILAFNPLPSPSIHLSHTPASNTCTANLKHPDYIKRDYQVCSPRSLVILYTTLVPESTSIFTTEFKG